MASETLPVDFNIEDQTLIDCSDGLDRGVLKKIIQEGTGTDTPFDGSTVNVHYTGRLLDGVVFDSSRNREPFSFVLGKRNVIKGWDMGVATMKQGEICELVCKPDYAYGKNGSGAKIPPDSTLVFQVELLSWADEDVSPNKDKQVLRRVVKRGAGYTSPNDGAKVKVRLAGKYEGNTFDSREVEFILDEGEPVEGGEIVHGIEIGIKKMKKLETSLFTLHPDVAFGREGYEKWNIPANAQIQYQITLLDFEKAKEIWSMNADEKMEAAEKSKEKGTAALTNGNVKLAIKHYSRMKDLLASDPEYKDDKEERRKKLLAISHLNLAAAHLKQKDVYEAKKSADEALLLDPNNVKGLYRRGMANLDMKEFENAKADFKRILELEPDNKAAKQQLAIATKQIQTELNREKQKYGGMFDKFAKVDAKHAKPETTKNGTEKTSADRDKSSMDTS